METLEEIIEIFEICPGCNFKIINNICDRCRLSIYIYKDSSFAALDIYFNNKVFCCDRVSSGKIIITENIFYKNEFDSFKEFYDYFSRFLKNLIFQ